MALKVMSEEYEQGESAKVILEYTPEPTCFNAEGVEHFGRKILNTCCCDSCKRLIKAGIDNTAPPVSNVGGEPMA